MSAATPGEDRRAPGPRCLRHEADPPIARCQRCGDLLCATCAAFGCDVAGCPHRERGLGADSWALPAPWESRQEIGWAPAIGQTLQRVAWGPSRFFRDLPRRHGGGAALRFGAAAGAIGAAGALAWVAAGALGSGDPGGRAWLAAALALAALPPLMHLRILAAAGLVWLLVRILGDEDAWSIVARVVGYAGSADLLLAVPGVGVALAPLVAGAWRALGLRAALGVPRWVALVAGFAPAAAGGLLILGVAAVLLWTTGWVL